MEINEIQLDAICELGNIGASHAATTLSQMLNSQIDMTVPKAEIIDISDVYKYIGEEIAALVVFEIQGEIAGGGYLVVHIPQVSILRMTNRMLGMPPDDTDREMNEMDKSATLEVGNIMASAFLDATAELLGMVMLPSPPSMALDMAHAAMESVIANVAIEVDDVILFETELKSDEPSIYCNIFMLPETGLLEKMLRLMTEMLGASH